MTIKQKLRKMFIIQKSIQAKEKKIQELRATAESIRGTNLDKQRVARSPERSARFEDEVDKIVEMEDQLKKEVREYRMIWDEGQNMIKSLEDLTDRTILEMRYINAMEFKEIARRLHYSEQTIYYRHAKAIKEIKNRIRAN